MPSEDRTFENVSGAPEKELLTNSKIFLILRLNVLIYHLLKKAILSLPEP
jgi:hypothetical protein